MYVPDDRRYTEEHEWVLVGEDGMVRMGISDYAQDALGDVVYVELPAVGKTVAKGDAVAEVESTKSVADVYAPVTGTVRTVNEALTSEPELVNSDPYGAGWFVEIDVGDASGLEALLAPDAYRNLIA
ncbi:MAG: glycine cleavage system protein GcvH [Acidimicrobiia bacterium]|nr:glycine cleavage system protein GcvH [Acidimicrobiia bacterium]MDH3397505.1 glycine cleavage system protein GcvH [Acidimicrobiia bacterium]MDH5615231.1 glycine cleavage system protein GcvH [Acidimicrobiia bacterium]